MNIYDLIKRAQELRDTTQMDSVSPELVGKLHEDTLKYINEYQLLASSPAIHKTYASVSAMQGDASPKSDLTGRALVKGQLVVIVPASSTDATAGDVYRYNGPSGNTSGWTYVSKIGGVPADAELSTTSTNPVQNAAVAGALNERDSLYYEPGNVDASGAEVDNAAVSRSRYIPVQKGDVVSSMIYRVKLFDKNMRIIGEALTDSNGLMVRDYTIPESCSYVRLTCLRGREDIIYVNGRNIIPIQLQDSLGISEKVGGIYPYKSFDIQEANKSSVNFQIDNILAYREYINDSILGLWIKNPEEGALYYMTAFRYMQASSDWGGTSYTSVKIAKKSSDGTVYYENVVEDRTSASIKEDDLQIFDTPDYLLCIDWAKAAKGAGNAMAVNDYLQLDETVLQKNNTKFLTSYNSQLDYADTLRMQIDSISGKMEISQVVDGVFVEEGGLNRDGSFKSNSNFLVSDFVALPKDVVSLEYNCYITESFNLLCLAYYNADRTFISGVETCVDETRIVARKNMPNDAAFVRVSTLKSRVPNVSYFKIATQSSVSEKVVELIPKVDDLGLEVKETKETVSVVMDNIEVALTGEAYVDIPFPFTIRKGMNILSITGTTAIYLKRKSDGTMFLITTAQLPYILEEDVTAFQATSTGAGAVLIKGLLDSRIDNNYQAVSRSFLLPGEWATNAPIVNSKHMYTPIFPCKAGDVVRGKMYALTLLSKDKTYLDVVVNKEEVVVEHADAAYGVITVYTNQADLESLTINGTGFIPYIMQQDSSNGYLYNATYPYLGFSLNTTDTSSVNNNILLREAIGKSILGLWMKKGNASSTYHITAFRYREVSSEWGNTEYTQLRVTEKKSDGSTVAYNIIEDRTSAAINDEQQVFETSDYLLYIDWRLAKRGYGKALAVGEFNKLDPVILNKNHNVYLMLLNDSSTNNQVNISNESYIALPIPQLAMVNIVATSLPTTKTDDIHGTLEFNDMQGNVFAKKIIMNAQGTSSLGLPKKNISIDIMDEDYEDSHEIKFGDWVAQDGFHLKSYMLDGIRVKPLAAYDLYESILMSRGVRRDRAWKRLQLPSDIPAASNNITDSYLQIDDGAKNHPSGFPIILYFNGVFHGIFCWQLKKHRANYHQIKDNAGHIHLDGNISNVLLWEANGNIDWDKWAGKKQESSTSTNVDGIEVRNPKKLILVDGSEYDADTNPGELISFNSAGYDSSNANMVRTAAVRASIESLSRRVYALTQMTNGSEKKSAIAEVFDVDSIIDFIIFSQITGNIDGYKKNWQWVTYDGVKWAVNAYDLDGVWGWTSWSYYSPYDSWIHNDTPPVTLIIENYLDEIKARYRELRDKGVLNLENIMLPLVNYVKVIGIDFYDMEFDKWSDGERDNLWRFETWMEESIKKTDSLMGYNS